MDDNSSIFKDINENLNTVFFKLSELSKVKLITLRERWHLLCHFFGLKSKNTNDM
jgi:hypothetical protein